MEFFWSFLCYSFLGFGLEVVYAHLTNGRRDRKRTLLLPLCPVYGVGATAILLLSPLAGGNLFGLFLLGGGAATLAEYVLALWYENGLGVSFWDYGEVKGNLYGRICLPFSIVWGCLSLGLVRWVHPAIKPLFHLPIPITAAFVVLVLGDLIVSGIMIRRSGTRDCLRWYDGAGMKRRG